MSRSLSLSRTRREFMREMVGACLAGAVSPIGPLPIVGGLGSKDRKVIIVTFGGGARDDETFSVRGHRNIPSLLHELAPQGCFFTRVLNRGILGHYVATASIATGVYETFDNFVAQRPPHPTVFEYFRAATHVRAEDAWVIAPSNNFAQIGASSHSRYGPGYGARLVLPKQLLLTSLHGASDPLNGFLDLMRDNYETDAGAATSDSRTRDEAHQLIERLQITPDALHQAVTGALTSDALSLHVTQKVMEQYAPSLIFLTFHDIDIAHLGAFSLYLNAVQKTDLLCGQLWRFIQSQPEYKDKTTLLILPDFGRDGDGEAGGNGFQHHRTGGALARTTWMLALGPTVHQRTVSDRTIESIDLIPTVGALLGFDTPFAQGRVISEIT